MKASAWITIAATLGLGYYLYTKRKDNLSTEEGKAEEPASGGGGGAPSGGGGGIPGITSETSNTPSANIPSNVLLPLGTGLIGGGGGGNININTGDGGVASSGGSSPSPTGGSNTLLGGLTSANTGMLASPTDLNNLSTIRTPYSSNLMAPTSSNLANINNLTAAQPTSLNNTNLGLTPSLTALSRATTTPNLTAAQLKSISSVSPVTSGLSSISKVGMSKASVVPSTIGPGLIANLSPTAAPIIAPAPIKSAMSKINAGPISSALSAPKPVAGITAIGAAPKVVSTPTVVASTPKVVSTPTSTLSMPKLTTSSPTIPITVKTQAATATMGRGFDGSDNFYGSFAPMHNGHGGRGFIVKTF